MKKKIFSLVLVITYFSWLGSLYGQSIASRTVCTNGTLGFSKATSHKTKWTITERKNSNSNQSTNAELFGQNGGAIAFDTKLTSAGTVSIKFKKSGNYYNPRIFVQFLWVCRGDRFY